MTIFLKLTLFNTATRLALLGAGWLILRSFTTNQLALDLPLLLGLVGLAMLADLGYVRLLMRPLGQIIARKLQVIDDIGAFDLHPVPTTTHDFCDLDNHINVLMRQVQVRFECEKSFTAYASHELLTPIAVLQSRFENIIADNQTPNTVAARLVESQQTLTRLSKIVQMLLLLARVENHQYLKNDKVSVWAVVLEVLGELEDRIEMKGIQVETTSEKDIIMPHANQDLLHTLLLNLIGNAVRYNVVQGRLTIGRGQIGDRPTLTITDTGPGMTPEQVATLMRYGNPGKSTSNGNGIGLQLIHTIARFHHTGLSVDSHPSRGTRITLTF
jgi:signal transduction histidine kinase